MLARPYLLEFARMGLSANRALRELRNITIGQADAAGLDIPRPFRLSMRRTDFLSMYRDVQGVQESRRYVSAVGREKSLDPRRFPSIDMDIDRRYRYTVRLDMRNTITGDTTSVHRTLYDDTVLTRSGAGDAAVSMFDDEYGDTMEYLGLNSDIWEIDQAVAVEAYHHQGWGY